jgi:hypothetical protein
MEPGMAANVRRVIPLCTTYLLERAAALNELSPLRVTSPVIVRDLGQQPPPAITAVEHVQPRFHAEIEGAEQSGCCQIQSSLTSRALLPRRPLCTPRPRIHCASESHCGLGLLADRILFMHRAAGVAHPQGTSVVPSHPSGSGHSERWLSIQHGWGRRFYSFCVLAQRGCHSIRLVFRYVIQRLLSEPPRHADPSATTKAIDVSNQGSGVEDCRGSSRLLPRTIRVMLV